ncbi:MAG TPA: MarR family transcriptional regulator [Candidatus Mediterraneibacter intestinigallinarum]|nr:MarR family transcriptional regulator [Candidatus Mediterraneibacter intestinigallinarum]
MKRSTELFIGLRSLFRLYDKLLKKVCTEHNLTVIEADIISFLQNNPGKDTAADIVELRMLSKGAVSKGVDSLIQKSLLERVPDTEDRRKIHLRLMPQAGSVTETVDEVRDEFLETVLDGFTKEELEIQTLFLQKLFDNTKKAIEGRDWS